MNEYFVNISGYSSEFETTAEIKFAYYAGIILNAFPILLCLYYYIYACRIGSNPVGFHMHGCDAILGHSL